MRPTAFQNGKFCLNTCNGDVDVLQKVVHKFSSPGQKLAPAFVVGNTTFSFGLILALILQATQLSTFVLQAWQYIEAAPTCAVRSSFDCYYNERDGAFHY
jgi:hypothetical protein